MQQEYLIEEYDELDPDTGMSWRTKKIARLSQV
jgi:hypothetical protein